jgi:hypothetical protein
MPVHLTLPEAQQLLSDACVGGTAMRQVWYVVGETHLSTPPALLPTFFSTKLQAEAYARELFLNDSAPRRYARVMYATVIEEK